MPRSEKEVRTRIEIVSNPLSLERNPERPFRDHCDLSRGNKMFLFKEMIDGLRTMS
jgi:hypothetical protein